MARNGVVSRIAYYAALGMWLAMVPAAAAPADDRAVCANATGDAAITACASAIASAHVGDYARAVADFTEVIRLDPKNADAFYDRGRASHAQGGPGSAMADYSEAIHLDPQAPEPFYNRGIGYFELGYFAEAADDLLRAEDLADDPYAMLWRFLARGRLGQDGAPELAANALWLKRKDWPYPVIEFYLGRRTLADMRSAAERHNEQCEAEVYAGLWLAWRSAAGTARAALLRAADACPRASNEYGAAVAELNRLPVIHEQE